MSDLEARLSALETHVESLERGARRWRRATMVLGAVLVSTFVLAATALNSETIKARKLEIVDEAGKVVMLADTTQGAGRLSLWASSGANVARLGANEHGGDFIMWNAQGRVVGSLYATAQGARIEANAADGKGSASLDAATGLAQIALTDADNKPIVRAAIEEAGGVLQVLGSSGQPAASIGSRAGGGFVVVQNSAGSEVGSMLVREDGTGKLLLADGKQPNILLETGADGGGALQLLHSTRVIAGLGGTASGGLLNLMGPEGRPVVILGQASNAPGGALAIRDSAGVRVARIGIDPDGYGELAVYGEGATRKKSINARDE